MCNFKLNEVYFDMVVSVLVQYEKEVGDRAIYEVLDIKGNEEDVNPTKIEVPLEKLERKYIDVLRFPRRSMYMWGDTAVLRYEFPYVIENFEP